MKTKALRLYGAGDLRLEEFDLPDPGNDELLVKIVTDVACMSTYKAVKQGTAHKRVPDDIADNPIIVGHEFCGEIIHAGANVSEEYSPGKKFVLQPAMNDIYDAAGYSFRFVGGNTQYAIIPKCYLDQYCLLIFESEAFYQGSLAEPLSCVIGAAKASYHVEKGDYTHIMGVRECGNMAVLAGCGPMGLAFTDYVIHCDRKPKLLVVTDANGDRVSRASSLLPEKEAEKNGVELVYINTSGMSDPVKVLRDCSESRGYDDVFVFAPVSAVIEQADAILALDGCLNFFAGPTDTGFSASLNFYNVHYNATHIAATSGGNTEDMRDAVAFLATGKLNSSMLISHIGGLDAAADTILCLPDIPGFKKLIYNGVSMPLTAIEDFQKKDDPLFKQLAGICDRNNGLWSAEAERVLLDNAPLI